MKLIDRAISAVYLLRFVGPGIAAGFRQQKPPL